MFQHYVRSILDGMDADKGTADWVRELSPCLDWIGQPPEAQTALFLRAAFRPDERLFIFHKATRAEPWVNLRPTADWLERMPYERLSGDLVKINPLTGKEGRTASGQPSFASQDCLSDYPFVLLEFDAMPLPWQFAFWRGFILKCDLADALVSLTFSGGKSLHGLLHVGCHTPDEWQAVRQRLIALFASDEDARFRVDPQALHPLIGTRLPGVTRRDKGTLQELVYLNPAARFGNGWIAAEPPPVDFTNPPCGEAYGKGLCGVCDSFGRCPFADRDAIRGTTLKGGAQC